MNEKRNNMRIEFLKSYQARFPLRAICEQAGCFYGETQEHYETYQAATQAERKRSARLVKALKEISTGINAKGKKVDFYSDIASEALREYGEGM